MTHLTFATIVTACIAIVIITEFYQRKIRKMSDELDRFMLSAIQRDTTTTRTELRELETRVIAWLRDEIVRLQKTVASNRYYKDKYKKETKTLRTQLDRFHRAQDLLCNTCPKNDKNKTHVQDA